jgi:hypothetical protein
MLRLGSCVTRFVQGAYHRTQFGEYRADGHVRSSDVLREYPHPLSLSRSDASDGRLSAARVAAHSLIPTAGCTSTVGHDLELSSLPSPNLHHAAVHRVACRGRCASAVRPLRDLPGLAPRDSRFDQAQPKLSLLMLISQPQRIPLARQDCIELPCSQAQSWGFYDILEYIER